MVAFNACSSWILTVTVVASLGSMASHAADLGDREPTQEYASRWGLGAGVGIERSPYKDVGNETKAIPLLSFQNRYVRVFGTTVDAILPSAGPLDFSIRAEYDIGGGFKSSDSSYLSGMDDRKGGLWLGLAATWHSDLADVSLEWMRATNKSKGNRIKLAVERSFEVSGRTRITPYVGIERSDRKDVNYYFGVENHEVRFDRPAYEGSASVNIDGGVRIDYAYTKQHNFFVDVGVQRWGSAITDSPLVDRSTTPSLRVGYLYRF